MEEKKHDGEDLHDGTIHVPQPGMKPPLEKHEDEATEENRAMRMKARKANCSKLLFV
jgi:hypothetical protein